MSEPNVEPGSVQDYAGCLALPLGLIISFAGLFAYGSQVKMLPLAKATAEICAFAWGPLLVALGLGCFFFQKLKKATFIAFAASVVAIGLSSEYLDDLDRYLFADIPSK